MLKKIFDKNVSAATGQLQDVVPLINGLVAQWLTFKIKLTFTTTSTGTTLTWSSWKRAALVDFWYRDQNSDQSQQGTRNETLESLGQRASLYMDGSLVTSDTDLPETTNCTAATAGQTVEFVLRIPFVPAWCEDENDLAPALADLGLFQFVFNGAPTIDAGTVTVTAIEVIGFAHCRAKRKRTVVARRLFSRIPSQLPVLNDSFDISDPYGRGATRLASAIIASSDGSGSPITNSLQPIVAIDGQPIVEGTRLTNVASAAKLVGDIFYPNSNSQRTYAPTLFAYLVPPTNRTKLTELPIGQRLTLTCQSSTVASGTQYVLLDQVLPLPEGVAARAIGVPDGAVTVERDNGGNKQPSGKSVPFIPAVVTSAADSLRG